MHVSDVFLQTNFNVDNSTILNELFHEADQVLRDAPAGTKIPRTKLSSSMDDSDEDALDTPSSFLRIDGPPHILMLASGVNKLLGQGTSARVKLALDREGNLYAVKIFTPPRSIIQRQEIQNIQEEHRTLQDLHIAPGDSFFSQKKTRVKLYSIQRYLGHPLDSFLKANPDLGFQTRIHLAIALCKILHHLHTGQLSQVGKPYVHFDLKPQNITIQLLNEHHVTLHLVDFGSARPLISLVENETALTQKGSLIYLPVDAAAISDKMTIQMKAHAFQHSRGMVPCDLISLKRILNFHRELLAYYPACSIFREEDIAQLSPAVKTLLSTIEVDTTAPDETALFIAAALANELSPTNERQDLETLKANPPLQQLVVDAIKPPNLSEELESERYLAQILHA